MMHMHVSALLLQHVDVPLWRENGSAWFDLGTFRGIGCFVLASHGGNKGGGRRSEIW